MMVDGRHGSGIRTFGERRVSRRRALAGALRVVGGGALAFAATGPLATHGAFAQDQGIGAGGRTGGDAGQTDQSQGGGTVGGGGRTGGNNVGGGNRQVQGNAVAGGGGRTAGLPTVMAMPNTGAGDPARPRDGLPAASLLLGAGAGGAATLAWRMAVADAAADA